MDFNWVKDFFSFIRDIVKALAKARTQVVAFMFVVAIIAVVAIFILKLVPAAKSVTEMLPLIYVFLAFVFALALLATVHSIFAIQRDRDIERTNETFRSLREAQRV